MLHRLVCIAGCLTLIAAASPAASPAKPGRGPALETPVGELRRALSCYGGLAGAERDPVLLVHGTFADSEINWSWNYGEALPARGQPACSVDLPARSTGDIQVSTEYVVYAIRALARKSGRQVAIIGHSQGGLQARWALRWWRDLRRRVSDVIMFGTPNHGSKFTDNLCTSPGVCAASLYQMRGDSAFLSALNRGRETVGRVPFTAVLTSDDNLFVPPEQGALHGRRKLARNIGVQELCPGHRVDHNGLAFDGPTYAIAVDALDHRGPARPSRIDRSVCGQDTMPGVAREEADARLSAYGATLAELLGPSGPKATGEPPLACYATLRCRRPAGGDRRVRGGPSPTHAARSTG
jgi:pimeloyl-ACP methyl ester carboxylesterase